MFELLSSADVLSRSPCSFFLKIVSLLFFNYFSPERKKFQKFTLKISCVFGNTFAMR